MIHGFRPYSFSWHSPEQMRATLPQAPFSCAQDLVRRAILQWGDRSTSGRNSIRPLYHSSKNRSAAGLSVYRLNFSPAT